MACSVPALVDALREVRMVSLSPPPTSWTDAIGGVAKRFMNARVCFYEEVEGDYDPITGLGDEGGIEPIWLGLARVQQLRSPQKFATDYQADTSRAFRFQVAKDSGLPFLPQGVKGRVLSAGVSGAEMMSPGDGNLELLAFVVDANINGSHQAVKTIELTANMHPVKWDWTVDENGAVVM